MYMFFVLQNVIELQISYLKYQICWPTFCCHITEPQNDSCNVRVIPWKQQCLSFNACSQKSSIYSWFRCVRPRRARQGLLIASLKNFKKSHNSLFHKTRQKNLVQPLPYQLSEAMKILTMRWAHSYRISSSLSHRYFTWDSGQWISLDLCPCLKIDNTKKCLATTNWPKSGVSTSRVYQLWPFCIWKCRTQDCLKC